MCMTQTAKNSYQKKIESVIKILRKTKRSHNDIVMTKSLFSSTALHDIFALVAFHNQAQDNYSYNKTLGYLFEAISQISPSFASILIVHFMTTSTVARWGTQEQKNRWLPLLTEGKSIGAFALSEPEAGSDIDSITTTAEKVGKNFKLTGKKRWISAALIANLFLVSTKINGNPTCFLMETPTKKLTIQPINDLLGFRSALIGELSFDGCLISKECMLGPIGSGFSVIANYALDLGRFLIAWTSLGIAKKCLSFALEYVSSRKVSHKPLLEQPTIRAKIGQMFTLIKAAEALCEKACQVRAEKNPDSLMETNIAKYYAAKAAHEIANITMHLYGASGLLAASPIHSLLMDAKVVNLIEGTTEIQEQLIADYALLKHLEKNHYG